ncbi:MAG: hypothetical protein ACR2JC_06175 [Chloroflexota bacterium]
MAGVLAQYAPRPLMLPYLIQIGLLGVALLGVWAMSEPLAVRPSGGWQIQRPDVPAANA